MRHFAPAQQAGEKPDLRAWRRPIVVGTKKGVGDHVRRDANAGTLTPLQIRCGKGSGGTRLDAREQHSDRDDATRCYTGEEDRPLRRLKRTHSAFVDHIGKH